MIVTIEVVDCKCKSFQLLEVFTPISSDEKHLIYCFTILEIAKTSLVKYFIEAANHSFTDQVAVLIAQMLQ